MAITRRDLLGAGLLVGGMSGAGWAWPALARAAGNTQDPGSFLALPDAFVRYGKLPAAGVHVWRVLAAGPPASVLLYALAPHMLLGWPHALAPAARSELTPLGRALPQLGRLSGRGSTLSLETLLALKPDLIIDTGTLNDTYRATARRTAQQTGVPYLLIDGDILLSAQTLQTLGQLLGVAPRGQLLAQQAQAILDAASNLRRRLADSGPTFYAARGADGLETASRGSIHTQALELCGMRNVVQAAVGGERGSGLGRVSLEQLLVWQPDWIFTHDSAFYVWVRQSPLWQRLSAIREQRLVLAPAAPFGWLDMPPGMNRLLGVQWISQTLQQANTQMTKPGAAMPTPRQAIIRFCELFWQHPPSDGLLDAAATFSALRLFPS